MLNFNKPVFRIIEEVCKELDIEVNEYSQGFFKQLKKDNKIRNIIMYKFDLNSIASCMIADDKYSAYEVLKSNNIPVIEHNIFFNPSTRFDYSKSSDLDDIKKIFDEYGSKLVIKANDSSQGKEVFLVKNKDDIKEVLQDIFSRNNNSVSVCPFEEIKNEYRVIVLDNECLFCYKKERPTIIGNGKKSIRDFIIELNIENPDNMLNYDYIPEVGENVELNWKFNLSGGAIPQSIDDINKKNIIEKIALSAAKAINIKFSTVDIIETKSGEFKVIEINATVCMNKFTEKYENGYEISKNIYKKAILKMFE